MIKAKMLLFDKLPASLLCPNNQYIISRVNRIKNDDYRSVSTLAYSLLSQMLSEISGLDISNITIKENEHGKPDIVSNENIHFNLSHTNGAVCCVLSDSPIGIDVEQIGDIRNLISDKCFTPSEAMLIKCPNDFYALWTLKESYFKALGTGINKPLKNIEFTLANPIECRDSGVPVLFKFYSTIIESYALSIASEKAFSPSDLIISHI